MGIIDDHFGGYENLGMHTNDYGEIDYEAAYDAANLGGGREYGSAKRMADEDAMERKLEAKSMPKSRAKRQKLMRSDPTERTCELCKKVLKSVAGKENHKRDVHSPRPDIPS